MRCSARALVPCGELVEQQAFAERLAGAERHEADGRPFSPFSIATAPETMIAMNSRGDAFLEEDLRRPRTSTGVTSLAS